MCKSYKAIDKYLEQNNLKVTAWNNVEKINGEFILLQTPQRRERPEDDEKGVVAHIAENDKGITKVRTFFTKRNINISHMVMYVTINGKETKATSKQ